MASEIVKVDDRGRMLIPEQIRKTGKIGPGSVLQIIELGKGVFALRKLKLPSKGEFIKICREVRKEVHRDEVEPWLKEVLKAHK